MPEIVPSFEEVDGCAVKPPMSDGAPGCSKIMKGLNSYHPGQPIKI